MTDMAPDKGAGVVPIVYMTSFPPFGGGVHSMITFDCSIPWMGGMELLTCTLLGGPVKKQDICELPIAIIVACSYIVHYIYHTPGS